MTRTLNDSGSVSESVGGPKLSPAGNGRHASVTGRLLREPLTLCAILLLVFFITVAIFAPILRPGDPLAIAGPPLLWPGTTSGFPLGTDSLGRDVFSGALHGVRVSLIVGVVSMMISLMIGIPIGAVAGFYGGRVDDLLVRSIEIFQTIPGFLLLIVLVAFAEPSVATVIAGIALVSWDTIARLTRAEFRTLRQRSFVLAARATGYDSRAIILREILPNALPPLIAAASILIASAILMESALSFMGLGDPNVVTWGGMIGSGREMIRSHWYLTAIPGALIVLLVLAFNLIGDGLNDALDPRGPSGDMNP